jgi:hypothetical protein
MERERESERDGGEGRREEKRREEREGPHVFSLSSAPYAPPFPLSFHYCYSLRDIETVNENEMSGIKGAFGGEEG